MSEPIPITAELVPEPPKQPATAPEPQTMALALGGVNVESLLAKAVDSKAAVDVLERLMAMRRELQAEQARAAFDKAMADFQAECPVIVKSEEVRERDNPNKIRYKYAPLDIIVAQVKGLLQKHGLSHSENAKVETDYVTAVCTIKHAKGHSETSEFRVPIDPKAYMNAAQKFASALTFAKRYAFCNALGILTGDADDDARTSGGPKQPVPGPRTSQAPRPAQSQARPAKPPPSPPAAAPHPKIYADANTRGKFLRQFEDFDALKEFLAAIAWLLPQGETVEDLGLRYVPITKKQNEAFLKCFKAFQNGDPAKLPYAPNEEAPAPEPTRPAKAAAPVSTPAPSKEAPKVDKPRDPEWWRDVIFIIPPQGMTRDTYLKKPQTIGELYEARHDAEVARRLFGTIANYEVKTTWVPHHGSERPRMQSQIDIDQNFRDALDACKEYADKHHGDTEHPKPATQTPEDDVPY